MDAPSSTLACSGSVKGTSVLVQASKVAKTYELTTVLSVDQFDVHAGDRCLLLGGNGAGKSTLLRILAGAIRPTSGKVQKTDAADIGYLGTKSYLYEAMTVTESVEFAARLCSDLPSSAVTSCLSQWNLESIADRTVKELSSGQKARVSLGVTLLRAPTVVLLDEPTSNLDDASVASLLTAVNESAGEHGAVCIATHDLERCVEFANRLVRLENGRVVTDIRWDSKEQFVKEVQPEIDRYREVNR